MSNGIKQKDTIICDYCGHEVEIDYKAYIPPGWYSMEYSPCTGTPDRQVDNYDFCSLECIKGWVDTPEEE